LKTVWKYICWFEKASEEGVDLLNKINIPDDWSSVLVEVAKAKVKIPRIKRGESLNYPAQTEWCNSSKRSIKKAMEIKKP